MTIRHIFVYTPDWSSIHTIGSSVGVFHFEEDTITNSDSLSSVVVLKFETVSVMEIYKPVYLTYKEMIAGIEEDDTKFPRFRMRGYHSSNLRYSSQNATCIQLIGQILRDHADKNNHRTHSS